MVRRQSLRALGFEALEQRTLLSLQVTSVTPTLVLNNAFNYIDVTFNEAINTTTFTPAEVTITGPSGAVAVNSISFVSGNTYQANFSSLSVRGDYATSIGPGITDTSGNPMNAPYTTTLEFAQASVIFTSNTSITESNTTYDGQDILIEGATVAIDGPHSFSSVQLVNGAVLTHDAVTATEIHDLDLTVAQQVIVDASSRIDVSGKGYLPGYTTGNSTQGAATGWSGGSYAGQGLGNLGSTNAVYGDYTHPDEPGSGPGRAPPADPAAGWCRSPRTYCNWTDNSWPTAAPAEEPLTTPSPAARAEESTSM